MFLKTRGTTAKTIFDLGCTPDDDSKAHWLVAGCFDWSSVREKWECDNLVRTIRELFGHSACDTVLLDQLPTAPTAVVVRPDENIVVRLDDELERFEPYADWADNGYASFVSPYIEAYWRDLSLSGRVQLVNTAQADPACVMSEFCPFALRDLVEDVVTT